MNVFQFIQSGKESYFCPIEKKVFTKTSIEGMEVVISTPISGGRKNGFSCGGDIKMYYISGSNILSFNHFGFSKDYEEAEKASFLLFFESSLRAKIVDTATHFIRERLQKEALLFLSHLQEEREDRIGSELEEFFSNVFQKKEDLSSLEYVWLKNRLLAFFSEMENGEVLDFFYEGDRAVFSIIEGRVPESFYLQGGEIFSIYKKIREAFSKNTPVFYIKDPEKMKDFVLKVFQIYEAEDFIEVKLLLEKEEKVAIKKNYFYSFFTNLLFYGNLDTNLWNHLSEDQREKIKNSSFVQRGKGIYFIPLSLIEGFYVAGKKVLSLDTIREIIE